MNKALKDMSNEELWQLFPIILTEHEAHWKEDYKTEESSLKKILGKNALRFNHIGSTAIPGLIAKPTIDILIEIKDEADTSKIINDMESAGYIFSPQPRNPAPHMMFMKGYTSSGFAEKIFHVHVRYLGDWDEIYFRDYLILHPKLAEEYGELKLRLKEQFEHNRNAYTKAKTSFVKRVLDLAKARK